MGLFDAVRAGASETLLPLLDDPGSAPTWLEPAALDEMLALIGGLRGREMIRELGYHNAKGGGFKAVLEPIIQLTLSMLGASPGSLFSRAQTLASVVAKGIEMKWSPEGKNSGTIRLRCDDPVRELSWAAWEGVCLYVCELAGMAGTVAAARPSADGRSCEIQVGWVPQAT